MSKIGRMPITVKEGVNVTINGNDISVSGSKGTMNYRVSNGIIVKQEDGKLVVSQGDKPEQTKALFGLTRALLSNMVQGVSDGFEKKLEMTGVGYRAQTSGTELTLSLGFSHQVKIKAPEGITFHVGENVITVTGMDKVVVGDMAAKIRALRKPEPYKGKGIKYVGERIRRKAGKSAKAVGAK